MTPPTQYKPFFAILFLAVALGFVHFRLVVGQQERLAQKVASRQAAQAERAIFLQMKRADEGLLRFLSRLPKQADLPKMVAAVSETAEAYQLPIPSVIYDHEDADVAGLTAVSISFDVTGDYLNIRQFINALEQSDLFFVIEQVTLATSIGEVEEHPVRLQIRLAAYMRSTDVPARSGLKQLLRQIG